MNVGYARVSSRDQNLDRQIAALHDAGVERIFLQVLSFVADNERANIRSRQAEGIAQARARGVQFGRPIIPPPSNWAETIEALERGELIQKQAADRLNMPLSTFRYRLNKCKE